MDGRFSVSFDDIRKVAVPVLRHRISTNFQAQAEGQSTDTLVKRLISEIREPETPKYERPRRTAKDEPVRLFVLAAAGNEQSAIEVRVDLGRGGISWPGPPKNT